jgi:hypothetical protein
MMSIVTVNGSVPSVLNSKELSAHNPVNLMFFVNRPEMAHRVQTHCRRINNARAQPLHSKLSALLRTWTVLVSGFLHHAARSLLAKTRSLMANVRAKVVFKISTS